VLGMAWKAMEALVSHLPWCSGTSLFIVAARDDATLGMGLSAWAMEVLGFPFLVCFAYERLLQ
jgi:hypothetical protein